MLRIGFLINPVAGMGGSVGLKGTDGKVDEARLRGAKPRAQERAIISLRCLSYHTNMQFITCSGEMGASAIQESGIS